MSKCKHRQRTYKIEKLFPTINFRERLIFTSRCEKCNRLVITLKYTKADNTVWQRRSVLEKAQEIYDELKPEIMGNYRIPQLKHLDIGPTYGFQAIDENNLKLKELKEEITRLEIVKKRASTPEQIKNLQDKIDILVAKKVEFTTKALHKTEIRKCHNNATVEAYKEEIKTYYT